MANSLTDLISEVLMKNSEALAGQCTIMYYTYTIRFAVSGLPEIISVRVIYSVLDSIKINHSITLARRFCLDMLRLITISGYC